MDGRTEFLLLELGVGYDLQLSLGLWLTIINHVKRLPLSLEKFLFLSKLIYFNWIGILIDLEIEHEKWNIGHDNLINVIGINFIYFNFWYLHPDAINLINAGEMTDFFI